MGLRLIRDLDERVNTGKIVEWQSPSGTRYRWERFLRRVGAEVAPGSDQWDWLDREAIDLRTARRIVFDAINEDEF